MRSSRYLQTRTSISSQIRNPISIFKRAKTRHFQTRAGTQVAKMTSHSYEVALYGKFLKGDLKPVLNRIALHSESAHQIHSREVIFDPPDAAQQREANQEPALLRALKELLEPDAKWYAFLFFQHI
jgi:hypothetical protein